MTPENLPMRRTVRLHYRRGERCPRKSELAAGYPGYEIERDGRFVTITETLPTAFRRWGRSPLFRGIWNRIVGPNLPYVFDLTGTGPDHVLDNLDCDEAPAAPHGYRHHPNDCQHPETTTMTLPETGISVEIPYQCWHCENGLTRPEPFVWLRDHWLMAFAWYRRIRQESLNDFRQALETGGTFEMRCDGRRLHVSGTRDNRRWSLDYVLPVLSPSQIRDRLQSTASDDRCDHLTVAPEHHLMSTEEVRWFPPCESDWQQVKTDTGAKASVDSDPGPATESRKGERWERIWLRDF